VVTPDTPVSSTNKTDRHNITEIYFFPEVTGIDNFTEVCDWWSVGTLLYELVLCRVSSLYYHCKVLFYLM